MVFLSNVENLAIRFSPYIKELQQFFESQGIQFGSPADLAPFADRVESSVPLRDDIGSLLRAILYSEAENITPGELLEMLVLAVAGQPVEDAAQEFEVAKRRLFRLVNDALRNRRKSVPDPGDIARAPESLDRRSRPDAPPLRDAMRSQDAGAAEDGSTGAGTPGTGNNPSNETDPRRASSARFFGSYAPGEPPGETHRELQTAPGRGRLIFIFALAALILAGGAFLMGRSGLFRVRQETADKQRPAAPEMQTVPAPGRSAANCTGTGTSQVRMPASALAQDYAHTKSLMLQKQYFPALHGLLYIAEADPIYPGVYLEIADMNLQLRRPKQARDAMNTQIAISDCVAGLPVSAVDAYCKSELSTETLESCHSHLARIRSDAQFFQATLVAQKPNRHFDVSSTDSKPTQRGAAPPGLLSAERAPAKPARLMARPSRRDQGLVEGQGTDSALGAYSKPQN